MRSVQMLLLLAAASCAGGATAEQASSGVRAGAGAAGEVGRLGAGQDPLAMSNLWQLTLGMLLVLGLIAGLAWLLKRTGRFQLAAGGGLRILGGLSMGSRERVVLLQVGDTQLLVGVAPGRVQTLHVLDQPLCTPQGAPAPGFAEQLGRLLKKDKTT